MGCRCSKYPDLISSRRAFYHAGMSIIVVLQVVVGGVMGEIVVQQVVMLQVVVEEVVVLQIVVQQIVVQQIVVQQIVVQKVSQSP